ncbi:MAG: hypothetical protein NC418_04430 [Muribaculaceae bacterium]|nr:hypothetical protein [Muribaculaceae bacterium]
MATVVDTLIHGLNQQMVETRLNTLDMKPFLFGTYFPVKKRTGFNWETLTNQLAKRNVAADLHADNGTIIRKRRPIFQSAKGDLPYIAISREMTRADIKRYQTERALAKDTDATALVEFWGEDIDFCAIGVQSELEYIAWALASNAGRLAFTTTTNATFANEFDLDYDVDDEQKVTALTDWGNHTSADIIGDLRKIREDAKKYGRNPRFAFVNLNELYRIASADQIIKACASFASNALNISQTPNLAQINAMLKEQAWLGGLQLRVIDQDITREFDDKPDITGNPFADHRVILSETEKLGSTQYDILEDDDASHSIIRAVRAHTVIKKYGTIEPKGEVTIGEADAIPVLDTAYRNIYVRTDNTEWE